MSNNAQANATAAVKAAKNDYDLHVLLVMRAEKCSKSKAAFIAWTEGPSGLVTRLAK